MREGAMPGWTGCDVCEVVDALRIALGDAVLPEPANFTDPRFHMLEARLQAEEHAPLAQRALLVAEGLRELGLFDMALCVSDGLARLVTTTDAASASLLAQAQLIRARSLEAQGTTIEANTAF